MSGLQRIAVFGLGYVGSVTAAGLCRDGRIVHGVDVDRAKVAEVAGGVSPVSEPGVEELLKRAIEDGRLSAGTDVESAVDRTDAAVVCVGTPSDARGEVDSGPLERVFREVGGCLRSTDREYLIVVRSTVLPGTIIDRLLPALEDAVGEPLGGRVRVAVNPEFLREGTALADYDDPAITVAGSDHPGAAAAALSLLPIGGERFVTDLRTACLVKYACNAFHATKIAFANEIGQLAAAVGGDGLEVMRILAADGRLNASAAYLRPGFAFGGSCLPKDLRALSRLGRLEAVGLPLIDSVLASNEEMLQRGEERVMTAAQEFAPRPKVGLAGLSFKAGTDDLRESPSVRLAERLIGRGVDLRVFDPGVTENRLRGRNRSYVDTRLPHLSALLVSARELIGHADVLVKATDVADALPAFSGCTVDLRTALIRCGESTSDSTTGAVG